MSWQQVTLSDVATAKKGKKPKTLFDQPAEGRLPYIDIKAFEKGVVRQYAEATDSNAVNSDQILVVWDGARSGLVGRDCAGALGSTLAALQVHGADLDYVFRFLQSKYDEINSRHKGTGIPHVDPEVFWNLELPLPPTIEEQRRIVAKLDQITARIEEARARLDTIPAILKRFRQSVLAAACSGRLTAEWRKNNSPERADVLLTRIVKRRKQAYSDLVRSAKESGNRKPKQRSGLEIVAINTDALPDIPDSWTYCRLQNLGEFTRGRSKHRPRDDAKLYGGSYPFIQTGDVANSGGKITSHRQTYSEAGLAQGRLFPAGTLCITIAANIADTAILTFPACFPDSVVGLIPDEEFLIEWARYYIQVIQNDLETYAPATAQKNINMEILELVSMPLPPYQEQTEIVRRVEALFKQADAIEARYKTARAFVEKLTPAVLAKAFRGELG